jgi:hypothetical protein
MMTVTGHYRRTWLVAVALVTLMGSPAGSAAQIIRIEFQIHPQLTGGQCAHLPAVANLAEEEDFPKVISKGWVALRKSSFDKERNPPCVQDVEVLFPSPRELLAFASAMSGCPQYPFYSGADHELQTAIFEYTAHSADAAAYHRLLSKNGDCASELNPPLYSILRKNPAAFLRAFAALDAEQQRVAAATQYDFNLAVEVQQLDLSRLQDLSPESAASARRFNELLAALATNR